MEDVGVVEIVLVRFADCWVGELMGLSHGHRISGLSHLVDVLVALCAAESPPPRPPLIAAASTMRTKAMTSQNVGFGSPHMRDDVVGSWSFVIALVPWYTIPPTDSTAS